MGNQSGIGQGFANLAKVFAPNSSDLINADVARQRVAADRSNAETSRMNAITARQKDGREAEIHDNLMGFDEVIATLVPEMNTPEGKARLLAEMLKTGSEVTPANLVGYLTAINADNIPQEDFSTVLAGSGTSWGNTPQGAREASAVEIEKAKIAAGGKSSNLPSVSAMDNQRATAQIGKLITEIAGQRPDQDVVNTVTAEASRIYQQTKNWTTAIQEAVKMFDYETSGFGWYNPLPNKFTLTRNGYIPLTGPVTPPANAVTPPANAVTPPVEVPGLPDPTNLPEGQRLQDNATGQVTHVVKNGQWVPAQ